MSGKVAKTSQMIPKVSLSLDTVVPRKVLIEGRIGPFTLYDQVTKGLIGVTDTYLPPNPVNDILLSVTDRNNQGLLERVTEDFTIFSGGLNYNQIAGEYLAETVSIMARGLNRLVNPLIGIEFGYPLNYKLIFGEQRNDQYLSISRLGPGNLTSSRVKVSDGERKGGTPDYYRMTDNSGGKEDEYYIYHDKRRRKRNREAEKKYGPPNQRPDGTLDCKGFELLMSPHPPLELLYRGLTYTLYPPLQYLFSPPEGFRTRYQGPWGYARANPRKRLLAAGDGVTLDEVIRFRLRFKDSKDVAAWLGTEYQPKAKFRNLGFFVGDNRATRDDVLSELFGQKFPIISGEAFNRTKRILSLIREVPDVEPWPHDSYRFPKEDPIYVKDDEGRIWEILVKSPKGDLIIGARGNEYRAFRDNFLRLKPVDFEEAAHLLGLKEYPGDPLEIWEGLRRERFGGLIAVPDLENYERDGIYRVYVDDFDGHEISFVVPDDSAPEYSRLHEGFGEDEIVEIYKIVASMPRELRRRVKTVMIWHNEFNNMVRDNEFDNRDLGTMLAQNSVLIEYPWEPDIEGELFRKFGYVFSWAGDNSPEYQFRLEAAVGMAMHKDGSLGYRSLGGEKWHIALARALENFANADPAMQQLVLNLMLNPDWKPR